MISKTNRLVGAILLVSGTTIGAAMLALPVTTGLAGFIPALLVMTAVWLFMMLTAFYLLEVNLRLKGESNIISMMRVTLGKSGEIVSWITYLLLLYALIAAYMVGASQIVSNFFPIHLPDWGWPLIIFVIFAICVYCGTQVIDFLNRLLIAGLILAYLVLIFPSFQHMQASRLAHFDWGYLLPSVAVVMTTFGYHIIIPTLTTYLEHDVKLLKRAIVIGSVIPYIIYVIWQAIVMGIVPIDHLKAAADNGEQVTFYLAKVINSPIVSYAVRFFALFAIVTSLLGVALSLSDFLADGLKIKKTRFGKGAVVLLTFLPPLLFAIFYPQGFIFALHYAGIFVVILLALLPALMAYFERYGKRKDRSLIPAPFKVWGGKPLVVATIIGSLGFLLIEVFA